MALSGKLKRWQDAGLITADQSSAIHTYEQARKGGRFIKGLAGAALFAILCGVLAIIAANWMDIPASFKLGIHILINAVVAFALWRSRNDLRRDGLCLLLFGLTLTLIILIGQVFQLGGGWANALMLWLIITAPMMALFGNTHITVTPWMMAFLTTIAVVMEEYLRFLPNAYATMFITMVATFLPIGMIADGNIAYIRRLKPVWADVFIRAGFALIVALGTIASLLWYQDYAREMTLMAEKISWSSIQLYAAIIGIFALSLAAQALYAAKNAWYKNDGNAQAGAMIAALSTLSMMLPVLTLSMDSAVFAALHFITLWVAIGFLAQRQGWHRIVSLAIALIALRVFVIYLELFGNLMTTGVGLIGGGVVMLALIAGSRKIGKRLKERTL